MVVELAAEYFVTSEVMVKFEVTLIKSKVILCFSFKLPSTLNKWPIFYIDSNYPKSIDNFERTANVILVGLFRIVGCPRTISLIEMVFISKTKFY